MRKNTSAGIVLFERHHNDIQIIMVKRRTSYAYGDFVNCHFPNPKNSIEASFTALHRMFSHMTAEEKKYISSNSPEIIFCIYWLVNPLIATCPPDIMTRYRQFEECFRLLIEPDLGRRLSTLIYSTNSVSSLTLFEFPKGRIMKDESPMNAAQRELSEETNFNTNSYVLWDNLAPYEYRFTAPDNHEHYITHYYFGEIVVPSASSRVNINDWSQKIEISEIAKFNINTIMTLFPCYKGICNYITNKIKDLPEISTVSMKM